LRWRPAETAAQEQDRRGRAETHFPDKGPHGFDWGYPKTLPETEEAATRAVTFIRKHFH
jgi:hypothetical protein